MPRVDVTLNGRVYPVACDEGQEERLQSIAGHVEARLQQARQNAPTATDIQLLVLTSLLLADEIFDMRAAQVQEMRDAGDGAADDPADETLVAAAVDHIAERIGAIAARLEGA